jgi:multidrug efflux pump subunit AcrA (membrane-fusion protein)
MLAEANLPNPDHLLQPGSFAEVEVALVQHPNAIVIPPAALVIDHSGQAIFIVENGHAKKVSIETGIDDGRGIEVTKGLQGTEQIVTVGQSQLTEGAPVTTTAYNLPDGKPASQRY